MQNCRSAQSGMTLVELLVVVAIVVLLLAVSVPRLKPMLESRRTSNAAQVLAGAFKHARMKSIQEGKSYGIRLIPYEAAPAAAVQLRLVKEFEDYEVNEPSIRVVVENGRIIPYRFDETKAEWQVLSPASTEYQKVAKQFKADSMVQFNRIGRFFPVDTNLTLKPPFDNLNLADDRIPMEYRISRIPNAATWLPPVVMPYGTIVDIAWSGGETVDLDGKRKAGGGIPPQFLSGDETVVMFSPAGHVDWLYVNGEPKKVNEMLYFCVGDWDRQMSNGTSFADDKKSNLDVPATYWVTLHPKNGGVRIAENAPSGNGDILEKLENARKFAKEHFFEVGER